MSTTAIATAKENKPTSSIELIDKKDRMLLSKNFSFSDFLKHTEISYDDRWEKRHEWRVRGNAYLHHWIFDHCQPRAEEKLTDIEVLLIAYQRIGTIKKRKGQLSFGGIYQKWESVEIVPKKGYTEHGTVRFVQDCVDKLWRWETSYFVHNGGCSAPVSFEYNIVESKEKAILAGAYDLKEMIVRCWEYKDNHPQYVSFAKKIDSFITNFEAEIRQPTLF